MYDSVTFWINRGEVSDEQFESGRFFLTSGRNIGAMQSMRVEYTTNPNNPLPSPNAVKVCGSIPKWANEDDSNAFALTFAQNVKAIDDICDWLRILPDQARVSGLEFGSSYQTSQPPVRYNELLWAYPRSVRSSHNRSREPQTITFQSTAAKPTFCHTFYDKRAEMLKRDKGDFGANLLRYEVRFSRQLKRQTKWNGEGAITLSTLQTPQFYSSLIDYYTSTFDKIIKLNEMNAKPEIKTAKQGADLFFSQTSNPQLRADPTALNRFMDDVKRHNPNLSAQTLTRMRSRIREVIKIGSSTAPDGEGMMTELRELIVAECERCAPPVM